MEFRRSAHHADRRRRVMLDERAPSAAEGGETPARERVKTKRAKQPHYSEAASPECQPALTDLIPQRPFTLVCLALLGWMAIAAVQSLFAQSSFWRSLDRAVAGEATLAAFDVRRGDSVAGWLAAMLLAAAAGMALLVFLVRRHRVDDYRGRYRVWIVAAAALLLASLDAIAQLHRAAAALVVYLAGGTEVLSPETVSAAGYSFLIAALAARMAFEMRDSRGALAYLIAGMAAFAAMALVRGGWLPLFDAELFAITVSSAWLAALLCVLLAVCTFGRYVYLDAQGRLPVKQSREARAKAKAAKAAARQAERERLAAEKAAQKEAAQKEKTAAAKPAAAPAKATPPAASGAANAKGSPQPASANSGPARGISSLFGASIKRADSKPAAQPAAKTTTAPARNDDEEDDDDAGDNSLKHLSRAERKKLKRMERRQQRRAA